MRRDVELLFVPAVGVDLGNAGHLPQLREDDPVLDGAQRGRVVGCAVGLARAGCGFDCVEEDLAQAGGNRPHLRLETRWQVRLLQALVDELAREVEVCSLVEHHRDLRQAVTRQRACVGQVRQARNGRLDGESDPLLDFER